MSDLGWYGRTWHDRRQNERIDSLSWQLESQQNAARRLTAKLSSVQGNMELRLQRLTTAFDAFVELSDLREELRAFQAETAARSLARRVLVRLVATREAGAPPDMPDLPDTPGYWLPHALAGLVALVRHDSAEAEAQLAAARGEDATRTDLFVCLALVLSGRGDQAAKILPPLLGLQPDVPVTRAQRELWLAATQGRFGATGRAVVAERLATLVAGLPEDERTEQLAAWRELVDGLDVDLPALAVFSRTATAPPDLVAPITAAGRLAALAGWYQRASAPPAPPAPAAPLAPADQVERPAPADGNGSEAKRKDESDPLSTLLQELVDEGAPEEKPFLDRLAELRRVVAADGGTPAPPPARWQATVDAPLALLLADARSADAGRRAVAASAAAPLLATMAGDLAATAAQPLPPQSEVRIGRHTLRYRSMGVDPATVAAAQASTLDGPPPPGDRLKQLAWGLIAAAALVAAIGVAVGAAAFGVTLGLVLAAMGVWLRYDAHQRVTAAQYMEGRRRSEWARLEQQIAEVETAVAELRVQAQRAAAEAPTTRARLDGQLAAGPTVLAQRPDA